MSQGYQLSPTQHTVARKMAFAGESVQAIKHALRLPFAERSVYKLLERHGIRVNARKLAHGGRTADLNRTDRADLSDYRPRSMPR